MKLNIKRGKIETLGASLLENGVNFTFVSEMEECGVILYDKESGEETRRISFPAEYRQGNIHNIWIGGLKENEIVYAFYEKDKVVVDPKAPSYIGNKKYGCIEELEGKRAIFRANEYNWEKDRNPRTPYYEVVAYCLHVRGFTMHASSKVKEKGTYLGLTKKIPYLRDLGITTIELQPAYEYDELAKVAPAENGYDYRAKKEEAKVSKLNYWGYTSGYYYSPKSSYAFSTDAVTEFKDMIKAFHENNMEVIMQFYFPKEVSEREVSDILRFWVTQYHVDGFHIKGERTPIELIRKDPCFAKTKIWYYDFAMEEEKAVSYCGVYNDTFKYDMRRFLKGDEGMASLIMSHMRSNPKGLGKLNYITNYDGFTLMDLVSYDRKHNEDNKEDNRDGNDYNFSWNCGVEGKSRKKAITSLRMKQIKNALCLLFLSQASPLLFMGDEFGNTQNGNNNPYCQDNEITWINWKNLESNHEIYEFTKMLIKLRQEHPILHMDSELRLMDYISCGYPDLSYHGQAAWRPETEYYSRQIGMMLCGKYSKVNRIKDDDFFYMGVNMHWEKHNYALPKLPKGMKWEFLFCTEKGESIQIDELASEVVLPPRSVLVLNAKA